MNSEGTEHQLSYAIVLWRSNWALLWNTSQTWKRKKILSNLPWGKHMWAAHGL